MAMVHASRHGLLASTSSCSDGSFNINPRSDLHLNTALSRIALTESSQDFPPAPIFAPIFQQPHQRPSLPALDTNLPCSQGMGHTQGTQGFSTPVEQQFLYDPNLEAGGGQMDEDSRSPAPSPKKRHRSSLMNPDGMDSDCMSQDDLSQSRSQGEPSSCSKATAGPRCRPPTGLKSKKRQEGPSRLGPVVTRLNREYQVENKEIGHGNFSTVYRAVHKQCGKAYAIKRSKRPLHDANDLQAWIEEVKVLALVEGHPNIVSYHDSWSEPSIGGEYQHIKLELCGESLGVHVKAKQALPHAELWELTRQMASALRHIHSLGLAHLDVKPDNIMRTASGAFKLGDFGHAVPIDGHRGWTEGDARYLAAEMLKTRNTQPNLEKVDMFALGATLYELASGAPLPSSGDRWSALREGKVAMLPAVAQQLQNLIKKLMSHDPALRPDAASVLKTCDRQMGPLPLRPSNPSVANLPRTS